MGRDEICSWDDGKQAINLERHGYDFADLAEIFDGRFCLTLRDTRKDYGEERYNMLALFHGRVVNVTFTPREGRFHLISVRPASREERGVYRAKA